MRRRREAEHRGDADVAAKLEANLRAYRRDAARENLTDFAAAIRRRDWSYAWSVSSWALRTMPLLSVAALRDRAGGRAGAHSGGKGPTAEE